MNVTCEINDYSNPTQPTKIKVHNAWHYSDTMVELEVEGKRYTVKGIELIGAINKCLLNSGER